MKRTLLAAAAIAGTATTLLLTGGATAAHADGTAKPAHARLAQVAGFADCKPGYVCIITTDDVTTDSYRTYGNHNLHNKIGYYWVFNNQTGGAGVILCYGYNGVNCTGDSIPAGWAYLEDLTPINSVKLFP